MNAKNRRRKSLTELVKYCLIGCVGVSLDATVFYYLTAFVGVHYQLANFLSVSCGVVNNFFLNAFFNFKTTDRFFRRFGCFYLVGAFGWLLSSGLLWFFVEKEAFDPKTAKLFVIFIVTAVQFTLNKFVTFAKTPRWKNAKKVRIAVQPTVKQRVEAPMPQKEMKKK